MFLSSNKGRYFLFVILFVALFSAIYAERKVIKIGAIFYDQNSDNLVAFRHAVNRFNITQNMYNLETNVHIVSDSFKTGQKVCEMVENGISVIFGPESSKTNDIVQSIAESLEIPQFQIFWNPKLQYISNSDSTIFNLYPDPKLFAKALSTLLREMRWKSYTIIYENDEGLVRLQEVLKYHHADDPPITVKRLTLLGDHRRILKEIKNSTQLQFILDCETDHILDILQQAQEVSLLEEYHSYILTSLDAHMLDYTTLKEIKANITTLRLVDPNTRDIRNVVRDWEHAPATFNRNQRFPVTSNKVRTSMALLYDSLNMFLTIYGELDKTENLESTYLNCEDRTTSKHGMRVASSIKLPRPLYNGTLPGPLTGPIFIDPLGRRTNFSLQIVELAAEGVRVTGKWNSETPQFINFTFSQQERQLEIEQKLTKKVFRVASRIGAPYLMEKNSKGKGNDKYEGYSMDLIHGIAEILNFTYEFQVDKLDINYGSYDPKTKEWNGLIRQLLDRKADLAVCDLTITYERRRAVDFTMPFMTLGVSILYSKAIKEPPELFSFMHPLSLDIWLYMATAYLAISMIIFIVARFAPGDWENPHPCNQSPTELENIWNIKNCLWLTLGSLMTQGCDILPKGISTRTITGMWWFFSLIMCASYTANLAAFLTMERMGPTIESADDLTKQTKIKYGCVSGGATESFFRDSNFSTYHRMWTQMQAAEPRVFEKSNKEGVKRVKTSKRLYAFLMESSSIEYEMERDCELMQVGGMLDTKGYGIAMPVNSPYRTAISGAVLKMQEDGKLYNLKEKWWKKMHGGGKCSALKHTSEDTAAELGIDNVGGVFVVLGAGIAIAFFIAAAEFMWNVCKIAVEEQISVRQVLKRELKFAVQFGAHKKMVVQKQNEGSNPDSSLRSNT